jgi:enamine deaminase RidA (YjgF/YER057c/UK114 family)
VLAEGGSSWDYVVDVISYHVGEIDESVLGTMVEQLRTWCPSHQPLWTVLGVERLALPPMKAEIMANAVVSE